MNKTTPKHNNDQNSTKPINEQNNPKKLKYDQNNLENSKIISKPYNEQDNPKNSNITKLTPKTP
jgi:hypothetical protein